MLNKTHSTYLVEYYTKNPVTGERGWDIQFVHVRVPNGGDERLMVRERVKTLPHFDCVIMIHGWAGDELMSKDGSETWPLVIVE